MTYNTIHNSQVFDTVVSGALVLVVGQIFQKFVLEPIKEYKKIVGEIDNKLKYYSSILTNTVGDKDMIIKITDTMRDLSCQIESIYKQIPLTVLFSKLGIIEDKTNIAKVAQGLIFLSNAGGRHDSRIEKCDARIDEIRRLLHIESLSA